MNIRNTELALVLAFLLSASVVRAATFTIGAGTGAEADGTYINEAAIGSNYGSGTRYWLGGASSGADVYILANWPALKDSLYGRSVDACSLFVKPTAMVDNTDGLFACFRIRAERDWNESQATWSNYTTSSIWSTAGAKNTASDIFSAPVDAKTETQFNSGTYTPFDITSIARQWDGNDTANCRGVVLKQYGGTDPTQIDIGSDDNVTAANRPKIKVVYHEGIDNLQTFRRRRTIISLIHDYDLKIPISPQLKEKS